MCGGGYYLGSSVYSSLVPRPSHCPVPVLQAIKNWMVGRPGGRPGNKASIQYMKEAKEESEDELVFYLLL